TADRVFVKYSVLFQKCLSHFNNNVGIIMKVMHACQSHLWMDALETILQILWSNSEIAALVVSVSIFRKKLVRYIWQWGMYM
ncbi:hypothetical protein ACJX0J_026894, partial [Zea mays]